MSGHWLYSISFTLIAAAFTIPLSPAMAWLQLLVGLMAAIVRLAYPHRNLLLIQMTAQMAVVFVGGCVR